MSLPSSNSNCSWTLINPIFGCSPTPKPNNNPSKNTLGVIHEPSKQSLTESEKSSFLKGRHYCRNIGKTRDKSSYAGEGRFSKIMKDLLDIINQKFDKAIPILIGRKWLKEDCKSKNGQNDFILTATTNSDNNTDSEQLKSKFKEQHERVTKLKEEREQIKLPKHLSKNKKLIFSSSEFYKSLFKSESQCVITENSRTDDSDSMLTDSNNSTRTDDLNLGGMFGDTDDSNMNIDTMAAEGLLECTDNQTNDLNTSWMFESTDDANMDTDKMTIEEPLECTVSQPKSTKTDIKRNLNSNKSFTSLSKKINLFEQDLVKKFHSKHSLVNEAKSEINKIAEEFYNTCKPSDYNSLNEKIEEAKQEFTSILIDCTNHTSQRFKKLFEIHKKFACIFCKCISEFEYRFTSEQIPNIKEKICEFLKTTLPNSTVSKPLYRCVQGRHENELEKESCTGKYKHIYDIVSLLQGNFIFRDKKPNIKDKSPEENKPSEEDKAPIVKNAMQNAHTIPFPGFCSWEIGDVAKLFIKQETEIPNSDIEKALIEAKVEPNEFTEIMMKNLLQANLKMPPSFNDDVSDFKEYLDKNGMILEDQILKKIYDRLKKWEKNDPRQAVFEILLLLSRAILLEASETNHVPLFINQTIDKYSEIINTDYNYKTLLTNGLIELLNSDNLDISSTKAYKEYLIVTIETVQNRLNDISKLDDFNIKILIDVYGLFGILNAIEYQIKTIYKENTEEIPPKLDDTFDPLLNKIISLSIAEPSNAIEHQKTITHRENTRKIPLELKIDNIFIDDLNAKLHKLSINNPR